MKSKLIAILAATMGLVLAGQAQNMVEYSTLATQAAKSLGVSTAGSRAAQKAAEKSAAAGNGATVWEDKSAPAKAQPPAPPPPAVFILSSGERLESTNYFWTAESLQLEQGGTPRTIPMSKINVNATVAANHQRGIDLKIPNKSQIMLSF